MKLNLFQSAVRSNKAWQDIDSVDALLKVTEWPAVAQKIALFREGNADAKRGLPAICWMGRCVNGVRKLGQMEPTGLVMIDIDHCKIDPREAWQQITERCAHHAAEVENRESQPEPTVLRPIVVVLAHVTPSGKGLRIIFRNIEGCDTIKDNVTWASLWLGLSDFGDVDEACVDLTRISFIPQTSDILLINAGLFTDPFTVYIKADAVPTTKGVKSDTETTDAQTVEDDITPEEREKYECITYNGFRVTDIISKFVSSRFPEDNQPPVGQRHTFYNEMIRNFRNMVDNDPRVLAALLPSFDRPFAECISQCKSICRQNYTSRFAREFYYFLRDNGYYLTPEERKRVNTASTDDTGDPFADTNAFIDTMPKLPPVFREYVNAAPRDYKIPTIMGLLPILGTLTSYLSAEYIDGETHTTSFITILYAPASYGKSFMKKYINPLLADIKNRDTVSSCREQIYSNAVNQKGGNEKAPEDPHVTCRYMPAINSLPEVLAKMRNNQGYHMFTYTEEMDTFSKGSRGQGGDKSDLYRVAWDNGEYGQAYKSVGTFKGIVRLYWNILITGTPRSIKRYFKDIENGLITRCSFSDLGDQAFAEYVPWKTLNKRDVEIINRFLARCDENTYTEPLDVDIDRIEFIKPEDFLKEVHWQFQFRERQQIDLSWIFPQITKWLNRQAKIANDSFDYARDTFRRRSAVRGFRLALLCHALWPTVGPKEQKIIIDFVLWYMDVDLYNILRLFGEQYNDVLNSNDVNPNYKWPSLFDELPDTFGPNDLLALMAMKGMKTPARIIIHTWKKNKIIEETGKKTYTKVTAKNKKSV